MGSFTENDPPTAIAALSATVTDADTLYLESIVAAITNWSDGAAERLIADVSGTSLAALYLDGVLTISGPASIGEFQQVVGTLKYNNTSENPTSGQRSIHIYANDGRHAGTPAIATIDVTAVNSS